jgi:hypothetical protein
MIRSDGDSPDDLTQTTGHRWDTSFDFSVICLDENERPRREATHGSVIDSTVGVNNIDGFLQALLGGIGLYNVVDGVRTVQLGKAINWSSKQGMRRVMRSRDYSFLCTVENPAAPNDAGDTEQVNYQAQLAGGGDHVEDEWDNDNLITQGMDVVIGTGLSKTSRAGVVLLAGEEVSYAGELHTFTANKDTYRDLLPNGSMTFLSVGWDDPAPSLTSSAIRIGVTRTDGASVLSDRFLARSLIDYGPDIEHPFIGV